MWRGDGAGRKGVDTLCSRVGLLATRAWQGPTLSPCIVTLVMYSSPGGSTVTSSGVGDLSERRRRRYRLSSHTLRCLTVSRSMSVTMRH